MIIVSLTSLPSRKNFLPTTLNILLNQSCREEFQIKLYLPITPRRDEPWLHDDIPNLAGVEVYAVQDVGPLTKSWYALQEASEDDLIVTADDDVYYPSMWLQTLLDNNKRYPNEALCYRGRNLRPNKKYLDSKLILSKDVQISEKVDILTGIWGALYPKKLFKNDFFTTQLDEDHLHNDDIFISGYLKSKGITCRIIPFKGIEYTTVQYINPLYEENWRGPWNDNLIKRYFQ